MGYEIPTYTAWPLLIPDATPTSDGAMSAADKAKLDSLTPGGSGVTSFRYTFTGAEGNDFVVPIPAPGVATPYEVVATPVNVQDGGVSTFIDILCPDGIGDRTNLHFRCIVSAGQLDAGSQISFHVAPRS